MLKKAFFFSFIQPKENETPLVLQKRKVKESEYGKKWCDLSQWIIIIIIAVIISIIIFGVS